MILVRDKSKSSASHSSRSFTPQTHVHISTHAVYTLVHKCRQMDIQFCTVQYRQRSCGVTDTDPSQAIPQLFLSVPVSVPVEQTLGRIRSPSPMTSALLTIAII